MDGRDRVPTSGLEHAAFRVSQPLSGVFLAATCPCSTLRILMNSEEASCTCHTGDSTTSQASAVMQKYSLQAVLDTKQMERHHS